MSRMAHNAAHSLYALLPNFDSKARAETRTSLAHLGSSNGMRDTSKAKDGELSEMVSLASPARVAHTDCTNVDLRGLWQFTGHAPDF